MIAKVLLTRRMPDDALDTLQAADVDIDAHMIDSTEPLPREEVIERASGCAGIITMLSDRIDAEFLDRVGDSLKVVANYAVGFDNIDLEACKQRGIRVSNTPGVLTEATADLAWALILAAARHVAAGDRLVRAGRVAWLGADATSGAGAPRCDARHSRRRTDRHRRRPAIDRFRHEGAVHQFARVRGDGVGNRRPAGGAGRVDPRIGRALAAHPDAAGRPPSDRGGPVRGDEADGGPGEHGPRADHRRGGAGDGTQSGADRRRGTGRLRARAADRVGAWRNCQTWSCCRTWAAAPPKHAAKWPRWPPRT